jgi:hypothetical protein
LRSSIELFFQRGRIVIFVQKPNISFVSAYAPADNFVILNDLSSRFSLQAVDDVQNRQTKLTELNQYLLVARHLNRRREIFSLVEFEHEKQERDNSEAGI